MSIRKKILICDDEEGVRESLKLILEDDYDLAFASTGIEVIDNLKKEPIDLIMLDIKMPKMNGLETLRELKNVSPKTKVVIVSGYRSVEAANEAIKSGASDYMVKPFDTDQILKTLNKILQ
ncbi:MAG: response regulator [Candidatus Omnitrophica bacterium]|nr:response regulator [Candidatus Omnitrophota bacterium]